ncbi:unnamed protein product [Arabidopsis halleri]
MARSKNLTVSNPTEPETILEEDETPLEVDFEATYSISRGNSTVKFRCTRKRRRTT